MSCSEVEWSMFPNQITIFQTDVTWEVFKSLWKPEHKILLISVWRLFWSGVKGYSVKKKTACVSLSDDALTSVPNMLWSQTKRHWVDKDGIIFPPEVASALYFKNEVNWEDVGMEHWFGVVRAASDLGILTSPKSKKTSLVKILGSTTGIPKVPLKGLTEPIQKLIFESWKTKKFMVLTGGTGVGKTSQIPKILFWFNYLFGPRDNICIPRWSPALLRQSRPLCLALPRVELVKQVSSTLLKGLGLSIFEGSPIIPKFGGVQDDPVYNNTTKCNYGIEICTHRIAIKNIRRYESMIVDEIHEHDQYADILIAVLKKYSKNSLQTLMSATIDDDRERLNEFLNPQFVHIEGKSLHKVEEIHRPTTGDLESKNKYFKNEEKNIMETIKMFPPAQGHCGILFMARVAQCNMYKELLEPMFPGIEFIVVHGRVPDVNGLINKISNVGPHHKPQILISTPYLESSITIPNATVVYDTGRYWRTLLSGGSESPVNKGMADQRKGRVGRVIPGMYVKLYNKYEHWKKIDGEFLYPYILLTYPYKLEVDDLYIKLTDQGRWELTKNYLESLFPIDRITLNIYDKFQCNMIEFIKIYRDLDNDEKLEFGNWDTKPDILTISPKFKKLLKKLNLRVSVISCTWNPTLEMNRITMRLKFGPEKNINETIYSQTELKTEQTLHKIHNSIFV
ncbi:RNA-helicase DExH-NPH-II [Salmon gill poxvirus]|uniref:RNA-helicase DExH-NPH-II n=1 Tax=Salmon gill poxvirus TaxID=1680908 RepID=A0A0H4YFP1_9POXV|nr:RNA-helicase DExH-NPH-II [Salmon gill poxvirus]AKR04274.1 RNA-helicase DExH-NPH-II [Salmon gill poxvirus]